MVYFDTNVYLYAFCKNIDDKNQQNISIKLLEDAIKKKTLIVSEIVLYEYAFVANKLKEKGHEIDKILNFLKRFIKSSNRVYESVLSILQTNSTYKNSFDTYHVAFSRYHKCKKIITFDKDFIKFNNILDVDIEILSSNMLK